MSELTAGTLTFLFAEIEASSQGWDRDLAAMRDAHARYQVIVREAVESNDGNAYETTGDAIHAAFPTASQAAQAAIDAQLLLFAEDWPSSIREIKVAMALHTGVITAVDEESRGGYSGPVLNRVGGLLAAAHGGQVLLSAATQELVRDLLPELQPSEAPGIQLEDLGQFNLKDLVRPEHIFQLVIPGLPSRFPPLRTLDSLPNNLPRQSTPFIGRVQQTEAVVALLRRSDTHLVTLTGPGGTGKTRLALHVGAEVLGDYADGVWFVELATLAAEDHRLVSTTIAETLGVKQSPGEPIIETLKGYLKDKQMLLVLDNFEQVIPAAPQVSALLKAAPELNVLATSRTVLRIYGEREYPVPLLTLPDPRRLKLLRQTGPLPGEQTGPLPAGDQAAEEQEQIEQYTQYEAVRLFIERAQAVKADFEVTSENAPAIAEICVRLDGLPLAIELAAARIRMLPPQALLSRLSSRLKILTGGASDLPERQQTLRNAIEWSYDLLDDPEKQLFHRMAVFSGGRTLEALEAVCNFDGLLEADVLDGVDSLGSKSLLQRREGLDGEPRFGMLETIREYALEKLREAGEADAVGRAHALYFMKLAEQAEKELTGKQQTKWLNVLEDEHDNMRAAMRWARDAQQRESGSDGSMPAAEIGLRIAGALWRFWFVRGYFSEGRDELEATLGLADGSGADAGERDLTPNPDLLAPNLKALTAKALNGAGRLADREGDHTAARSFYEQGLALRRELDDKKGVAETLRNQGILANQEGDYPTARSLYEQSLELMKELGDKRGVAESLNSLGSVAYNEGDYPKAYSMWEQSLALMKELGDKRGTGQLLNNMAIIVADKEGNYSLARSLFEQALAVQRELGDKGEIATLLNNSGGLAYREGDYPEARSLFEQSLGLMRELGDKSGMAEVLDSLGDVVCRLGDHQLAHSMYGQSLELMQELGDKRGVAANLTSVGALAAEKRDGERGARLLGASEALLQAIGAGLSPDERKRFEQGADAARSQLGNEGFEQVLGEGRALSMDAAIELALQPVAYEPDGAAAAGQGVPSLVGQHLDDELHMKIDHEKKARQVEAITGTDYFRELQAKVTSMRARASSEA
jgi:predicted ATPase/class 3 adenylate cyclase/Tfp pilus assembly protein PilF